MCYTDAYKQINEDLKSETTMLMAKSLFNTANSQAAFMELADYMDEFLTDKRGRMLVSTSYFLLYRLFEEDKLKDRDTFFNKQQAFHRHYFFLQELQMWLWLPRGSRHKDREQ
ncbi:MAG: hypothetical protein KBT36_16965 [Kurthia sp.]|nr:hypothetical protein [Candidatus Kurthia equi]